MTVTVFQQANQLLREGKLEAAVIVYRQAIEQNPNSYLSYQNLGETLGKLGRWEEAVEMYGKAIELKPSAGWLHLNLSWALQQVGRLDEAQQTAEKAAKMEPKLARFVGNWPGIKENILKVNSAKHNPESQAGIIVEKKIREVVAPPNAFKSTQFYSDLEHLFILGNGESIDVVSRKLFLSQAHAAETGLHIVAAPSSQCEALSSDMNRCNSILVLANSLKDIADQKTEISGGYWKILQLDSESVLLSIFLQPGRFMTQGSFADILGRLQSFGSSDLLEVKLPSLKFLIEELLAHRGDAYIESVENKLEQIIDRVSSSVKMHRSSIVDVLNLLIFSSNIDAVQVKLQNYLNKNLTELQTTIDDSHKKVIYRRIDSCIYFAFELSGKNLAGTLAPIFKQAFDIMLSMGIPAPILSRGLRYSFLKAIELAQSLPTLIDLAQITNTDDSIAFLAIYSIIRHRSTNAESDLLKTWLLLKKIFELPKKNLISLVRDLRRTVPSCLGIPVSLSTEIISAFEITEKETPDRETWLARCLLLLYADCFDSRLLNWITHHNRIDLTSEDKEIVLALTGYDIPLIDRVNKTLLEEGFNYKVLYPSEYCKITDYMKANLAEWGKHSQISHQSYTGKGDSLPMISVILTTFNPDMELLRLSLESIIHQTYPALEIIVIDDHSPPESSRLIDLLVDEMRRNTPHLIVYQRNEKNVGQYVSRNRAIAISKGEFIAIQDDDDISHPERLQHQLQPMLAESSLMATHANHLRISENSRLMIDGDAIGAVWGDAPVSFIWRRQVFQEIGNFLPTKTRGDVEFRSRMRRHYSDRAIQMIAQPLVLMRGGMGTVSSNKEYYFRSALSVWRYMMNHIPIGIYSSQEMVRWIPTVLR
jgi:Glycosyl transferase family 2/Tetratricopeptide repeat